MPGKHGGRLLKGRTGAPGKKPGLTNPEGLSPSERNLEAESLIRDIQSALLRWQKDVARGRRLSDRAGLVLLFFITHCRRNPREGAYLKCWYAVERIARRLGLGKRTVERALAELKNSGILLGERERYENGKYGPRFFWTLTPPDLTKYAPRQTESPNRHITVDPDGVPNRHITVDPDGALLEEQRFEETSKKAEAENLRWAMEASGDPPRGRTPVALGRKSDDRIRRLQHRLRGFIEVLIPRDDSLYVWSMDPENVQEAVREVLRGVGNGASPVKSLLNLRRRMEVTPRESTQKMAFKCWDIFPDHTHFYGDARPGSSEPTCPVCRERQQCGEDGRLPAPAQPRLPGEKTGLRQKVVEERMSARIARHQSQLQQILGSVLSKDHDLYVWSMDPENVSNALRAVLRGMSVGVSPVASLGVLGRNGDYMSRTQQIQDCRVMLGRARNNATDPGPIDWQGTEKWTDDIIREAPELVHELFRRKKSALSPGRELYRGVVFRICGRVREKMRRSVGK